MAASGHERLMTESKSSVSRSRFSLFPPRAIAFSVVGGVVGFARAMNRNYWVFEDETSMPHYSKFPYLFFEVIFESAFFSLLGYLLWGTGKQLTNQHEIIRNQELMKKKLDISDPDDVDSERPPTGAVLGGRLG